MKVELIENRTKVVKSFDCLISGYDPDDAVKRHNSIAGAERALWPYRKKMTRVKVSKVISFSSPEFFATALHHLNEQHK